jgi:hypothetical protein
VLVEEQEGKGGILENEAPLLRRRICQGVTPPLTIVSVEPEGGCSRGHRVERTPLTAKPG